MNTLGLLVLCAGFLPPNDMKIPVGDVNARGIDEAAFNRVLDRVEAYYKPVIAAKGAALVVNRLWENPTVNASAQQTGKTWAINMYGGLARHKAVTPDGFALVACHEIGHHIGGYPKIADWNKWATNEGGSDYFATLKCLRRVLPPAAAESVDPLAKAACASAWSQAADRRLCESGVMAGVSVSSLLAELGGAKQPSLATPDPSVVERTNDRHPAAQCRLDTYLAGAVCGRSADDELSDTQPISGACTADGPGTRPLCWFKPPAILQLEARLAANEL